MRKFYSLIAMFIIAMAANADVLLNYEHTTDLPAGLTLGGTTAIKSVKYHTNTTAADCIAFSNGYTSDGKLNGNNLEVTVEGGLKAGDIIEIAGFFNNADDTKDSKFVFYVEDGSESGYKVLWTSEKLINGRLVADEPRVDTYTLEQDCEKLFIARGGNTGTNIFSLKVIRSGGITGNFDGEITSDPENNYYSGEAEFPIDQVLSALALSSEAELADLLANGDNVYIVNEAGESNAYTGNHNEFWMTPTAATVGWGGTDCAWFAGLYYDPAGSDEEGNTWESSFYCKVGQFPNYFKEIYTPSTLKVTLVLKNGSQSATFNVTLNVNAAPEPKIEAETSFSKLTVVKEYEFPVELVLGKSYEAKTFTMNLEGIYDALGVTAEDLDGNLGDLVFARSVNSEDVDGTPLYSYSDEMKKPGTTTDGWFGYYVNYDESTGIETIFANALKSWGSGCTIYTQGISLTEGEFSIKVGQFPGTYDSYGAQMSADLYIIAGSKAVVVKVIPTLPQPEIVDPSERTLVGKSEVTVTDDPGAAGDYSTESFSIDMAPIYEALGCEAGDLADVYAYAFEGEISDNHTEGAGGFYFNENGYIDQWGGDATFYITPQSIADGKYAIGQNGRVAPYANITEDKTITTWLVFQNGNKYWEVAVNYLIKAPQAPDEEFTYTCKGTGLIKMQMTVTDYYEWGNKATIDLPYVTELIGEGYKLYGDNAAVDANGSVVLNMTKSYTCTPYPGFWYGTSEYTNAEGQNVVTVANWGSNSFGITMDENTGALTFWQIPDLRQVGDAYTANIYLVNEETGDYVKYTVRVNYVSEITGGDDIASVGSKNVEVNVSTATIDADGYITAALDTEDLLSAFGIDPEELEAAQLTAPDSPGSFIEILNFEEEFNLNVYGYTTSDDASIATSATIVNEDGKLTLKVDDSIGTFDTTDPAYVTVHIAVLVNNQAYEYIVTLGNTAYFESVGINSIQTSASANIYTLNGVKVNTLQKGINIVEGKKVLVK